MVASTCLSITFPEDGNIMPKHVLYFPAYSAHLTYNAHNFCDIVYVLVHRSSSHLWSEMVEIPKEILNAIDSFNVESDEEFVGFE
jgi:hypothetical protein